MPDLKKAVANTAKAAAALMHEAAGSPPDREYTNLWTPDPQQALANDLKKRFPKHVSRNKNQS